MEHLNRLLKDAIRALGANKTPRAITRLGKCIAPLGDLLDNYDTVHQVTAHRADHSIPTSEKDMTCMPKELHGAGVFSNIPGCKHRSFKTFKNNPVLSLEENVKLWLKMQWSRLLAGLL